MHVLAQLKRKVKKSSTCLDFDMQGLYVLRDLNIYLILFRALLENKIKPRSKV
jgi:hypothetical protein